MIIGGLGTVNRFAGILFAVAYVGSQVGRVNLSVMPVAIWAYLVWAIVSIGWAIDPSIAWSQLQTLIQLVLIAALVADFVVKRPAIVRPVLWVYSVSAAITAVVGIQSYLAQGIADTQAAAHQDQNPAQFAAVLLPAFVFGLYEMLNGERRIAGAAITALTAIGVLVSGTRGAWVAVAVVVLILVLPQLRPRRRIAAIRDGARSWCGSLSAPGCSRPPGRADRERCLYGWSGPLGHLVGGGIDLRVGPCARGGPRQLPSRLRGPWRTRCGSSTRTRGGTNPRAACFSRRRPRHWLDAGSISLSRSPRRGRRGRSPDFASGCSATRARLRLQRRTVSRRSGRATPTCRASPVGLPRTAGSPAPYGGSGDLGARHASFTPIPPYPAWRHGISHAAPASRSSSHSTEATWPDLHPERMADLRSAARAARAFITVSDPLATLAKSITGVDAVLLPLGSDHRYLAALAMPRLAARAALDLTTKRIIVLFVGNLIRAKGVHELADAILARGERFLGVFVGDGPEKGYGIGDGDTDCLQYRGARPHLEIARFVSAADVLVLPSRSEGLPTVLVEAGSLELPVIASPVGGIPSLLERGRGALLRDISSVGEALDAFERNRSSAEAAAKRLREFVLAEHDVDTNAGRLLNDYRLD